MNATCLRSKKTNRQPYSVYGDTISAPDTVHNKTVVASLSARATSSFHLHLSLPRGFVRRFYFWLCRPTRSSLWDDQGFKKNKKNAICSSPWSHSLTLSSLHDVIGSMLGVLLQSLLQFPAVLADFYLSALLLLEEENVDLDLESDDDELHSFPQVQVRVPPWCQPIVRNCQARPGAETPPSYNPHPLLTWRNSLCEWEKGAAS